MFQKTKHIDTAFQYIRRFSIFFLLGCVAIAGLSCYYSYQLIQQSQERIYVLANGQAIEAYQANRKDNIPVEARDHVRMFHFYFFTLDPDDQVIASQMDKALYLADGSAKQQYDNLKENGYFASLVAGNISQEIESDSIEIRIEQFPYYFKYIGQVRIIRPTSIVTRSLVTEGYLRPVSRSDHNPHGFLIERWRTLSNQDIKVQSRR